MPSIAENKKYWDGDYAWPRGGDEWSRDWGTVSMQWYGTLLPRIHRFLPATTICEIGCGYGRWTHFLKDWCSRLVAVDVSKECIDACRKRFAGCRHVSCEANDGTSLATIADRSVDFVFSFDALPLVDAPTLDAYLGQLPRLLKDDGAAFLHHSNLGAYRSLYATVRSVPGLEAVLRRVGLLDRDLYWRDPGVCVQLVDRLARKHGLECLSQEVIRWGTRFIMIDAFSVVVKEGQGGRPAGRLKNTGFDAEARNLRRLARLYANDGC